MLRRCLRVAGIDTYAASQLLFFKIPGLGVILGVNLGGLAAGAVYFRRMRNGQRRSVGKP